ncbi:hypothetical protein SeMB42_g02733 [Synchytrium endobioticum]|uniref:Uncharacterized protein n=1 Tax=Synchytrium endobioticum TaxID=286115 RepID=A0A507DBZ7_9FUNG|nr:hypothetical protein SeMB42_g02733 [Synchytrium endobioticum]
MHAPFPTIEHHSTLNNNKDTIIEHDSGEEKGFATKRNLLELNRQRDIIRSRFMNTKGFGYNYPCHRQTHPKGLVYSIHHVVYRNMDLLPSVYILVWQTASDRSASTNPSGTLEWFDALTRALNWTLSVGSIFGRYTHLDPTTFLSSVGYWISDAG